MLRGAREALEALVSKANSVLGPLQRFVQPDDEGVPLPADEIRPRRVLVVGDKQQISRSFDLEVHVTGNSVADRIRHLGVKGCGCDELFQGKRQPRRRFCAGDLGLGPAGERAYRRDDIAWAERCGAAAVRADERCVLCCGMRLCRSVRCGRNDERDC